MGSFGNPAAMGLERIRSEVTTDSQMPLSAIFNRHESHVSEDDLVNLLQHSNNNPGQGVTSSNQLPHSARPSSSLGQTFLNQDSTIGEVINLNQ